MFININWKNQAQHNFFFFSFFIIYYGFCQTLKLYCKNQNNELCCGINRNGFRKLCLFCLPFLCGKTCSVIYTHYGDVASLQALWSFGTNTTSAGLPYVMQLKKILHFRYLWIISTVSHLLYLKPFISKSSTTCSVTEAALHFAVEGTNGFPLF